MTDWFRPLVGARAVFSPNADSMARIPGAAWRGARRSDIPGDEETSVMLKCFCGAEVEAERHRLSEAHCPFCGFRGDATKVVGDK